MGGLQYELDDNSGLSLFLEELIEGNYLEDAALGIAKKVVADGTASISDKQYDVFQKYVLDSFVIESCEMCGYKFLWTEKLDAYLNQGVCGYCQRKLDRLEVE
jgi:hypothetical protein